MECLQNRIDSFSKIKRVRNPKKPSTTASLKWPHPPHPKFIATPATLAEAGFYFTPGFDERDDVTCFMCEKQLAYWEAEDDPFDIHWQKCGTGCPWATVRCGLRGDMNHNQEFTFPDASRLPTSKTMERARQETFSIGDGWRHDQVKSHGANSRKMALAGFIFTPQTPGDDLATCLYCHLSLSGWDAEDEPLEEHRKRSNKSGQPCPFFSFVVPATQPSSRSQAKAPSKSQRPPKQSRSASTTKHKDLVVPMKTHDGDGSGDESDMPPASSRRSTAARSRQSRGIKTPKAHTRSQSRSTRGTEGSEEEETEEGEDREDRSTRQKKGKKSTVAKQKTTSRSRSKSVATRTANDEEDMATPRTKPSRSKGPSPIEEDVEVKIPAKTGKRKVPTRVVDSEEDSGETENVLRKSTRRPTAQVAKEPDRPPSHKPTRTRKAQATIESESQVESEVQATEDEGRVGRKPRQPSGSKAKSSVARKASRSKPKAEPTPEESTVDEEGSRSDDGEPTPLVSKPKSGATKVKTRLVKAKGKIKMVRQRTDNESEEQESVVSNNDDDVKVLAPSHGLFEQIPGRHQNLTTWDKDETNPLYVPKEGSQTYDDLGMEGEEEAEGSERTGERKPLAETNCAVLIVKKRPEQVNGPDEVETPIAKVIPPKEKKLVLGSSLNAKPQSANGMSPIRASFESPEPQGDDEIMTARETTSVPNNSEVSTAMLSTLPPLSKLPFAPSQSLTEAELDMTVEEWIRYQMEVEYDKFRRDGERELSRFKKRAEEVKSIIENL